MFIVLNPKKLSKIGVRLLSAVSCECECHFKAKLIIQNRYYRIPEGEERLNGTEAIFEEIVAGSFLKLIKLIKLQNPDRINTRKPFLSTSLENN